MRTTYKIYNNQAPHFITSTIVDWIRIFTSEDYYNILIEAIKYSQKEKNLKVYAYVLLDNHFHMIALGENLSVTMQSIKGFTAKKIIEQLKKDKNSLILGKLREAKLKHKTHSEYQIWQEGFHPQEIQSDDMFQQKADYIHLNPVRRNLVVESEDWKYSSAGYFYKGTEGVLQLNGLE